MIKKYLIIWIKVYKIKGVIEALFPNIFIDNRGYHAAIKSSQIIEEAGEWKQEEKRVF